MAKAMRLTGFLGAVPRMGARLLNDMQSQVATNARLTSGELRPLHDTVAVYDPDLTSILSVYKMVVDDTDYWLTWDTDVDAAKGPISGDTTHRLYYTGAGEPRVTNFSLATGATPYPAACYVLGVTPPTTAPGVAHAGGIGSAVSRAFVYTFVTQWGEESAPSPVSSVTVGKVDGTWTISSMDTAPPNSYTISAAAWSGGALTLTVNTTFGLRAGEYVTLSGLAPSSLNASWEVATVPGSTSFTITMANPGTITDGTGTATRDAPHNTSGMTKNIYWSQTDSAGTSYQLVKSSVAVADTSTTVAGSATPEEELPTSDWRMPPVDLKGILFHPSGAAVGFSGNQVCFSVPYSPYAWPLGYRFTLDFDVVGLGIFGTTVVACTEGPPYVLAGADPDAIGAAVRIDKAWPCLAKRGVVSSASGVMYPTSEGLATIGVGGATLLTQALFDRIAWEALQPDTFRATLYSDRYVASYEREIPARQLLILELNDLSTCTTANKDCAVVYGDNRTGKMFVVEDDIVYEWDSSAAAYMTYDWWSKEWVAPEVFNPAAARVDAAFTLTPEQTAALLAAVEAAITANEAIIATHAYEIDGSMSTPGEIEVGGVSFDPAPATTTEALEFQLYVDGALEYSTQVQTSRAFRLPAGYKANAVAVRLAGNVRVLSAVLGETMDALRTV